MRLGRRAVVAAGAGAVLAGLAGAPGPGPAVALAPVTIKPDALHAVKPHAMPPTTARCEASFSVACYQPGQIQQAYNLPALYREGIDGKGTTIVIADSFGSPTIQRDLAVFDRTFRLPAPPSFRVVQPAGKVPPFDPASSDMLGWAGETTLDVDYAHTIAPGANIVLARTPVGETEGVTGFPQMVRAEEYVLRHYKATVISQSFSATEQSFPSGTAVRALRGAYLEARARHVTVLSAAGDSGAANVGLDGKTYFLFPTTNWPPSDPLVTGVGGTQLHLDAAGHRTSPDTAWNDTFSAATNRFILGGNGPNPVSGGGGRSVVFSRPGYQRQERTVTGARRGVPDISMSAACDGAVDVYQSFPGQPAGWYPTCGTSEATPLFAGIVALSAQVAGHPLGLINPALYAMSAAHAPGIVDVTSGNNTVSFSQGGALRTVQGFTARPGYDLASGVGTVNAALFVPELAARATR